MGNIKLTNRPFNTMDKSEKMLYGLKRGVNLYQLQTIFIDWNEDDEVTESDIKEMEKFKVDIKPGKQLDLPF